MFQPWQTPYSSMDGNPINLNDVYGDETGGDVTAEPNDGAVSLFNKAKKVNPDLTEEKFAELNEKIAYIDGEFKNAETIHPGDKFDIGSTGEEEKVDNSGTQNSDDNSENEAVKNENVDIESKDEDIREDVDDYTKTIKIEGMRSDDDWSIGTYPAEHNKRASVSPRVMFKTNVSVWSYVAEYGGEENIHINVFVNNKQETPQPNTTTSAKTSVVLTIDNDKTIVLDNKNKSKRDMMYESYGGPQEVFYWEVKIPADQISDGFTLDWSSNWFLVTDGRSIPMATPMTGFMVPMSLNGEMSFKKKIEITYPMPFSGQSVMTP